VGNCKSLGWSGYFIDDLFGSMDDSGGDEF